MKKIKDKTTCCYIFIKTSYAKNKKLMLAIEGVQKEIRNVLESPHNKWEDQSSYSRLLADVKELHIHCPNLRAYNPQLLFSSGIINGWSIFRAKREQFTEPR